MDFRLNKVYLKHIKHIALLEQTAFILHQGFNIFLVFGFVTYISPQAVPRSVQFSTSAQGRQSPQHRHLHESVAIGVFQRGRVQCKDVLHFKLLPLLGCNCLWNTIKVYTCTPNCPHHGYAVSYKTLPRGGGQWFKPFMIIKRKGSLITGTVGIMKQLTR